MKTIYFIFLGIITTILIVLINIIFLILNILDYLIKIGSDPRKTKPRATRFITWAYKIIGLHYV